MLIFLCNRLLQALLVLLAMSALVFVGVFAIGNPVDLLLSPEADQIERLRTIAALGLDKPMAVQYLDFIGRALHGDLGNSLVSATPAVGLILERLPATLELAFAALLIALSIGLPLGLFAGLRPGSRADSLIASISTIGFSMPGFWSGMLLIMIFGVEFHWLPTGGRGQTTQLLGVPVSFLNIDGLLHLLLPACNLALFNTALIIRLARSGTSEAMQQDYVRFARAKGLSEGRIVRVHVLKNISIPIVTVVGMQFGATLAFAVVTETLFNWPGIGKLLIDSINLLDRPVIVAYLMMTVAMFVLINLTLDVIRVALDPRLRNRIGSAPL